MDSFEEVWNSVCDYCRSTMSETSYKSWIMTISGARYDDGTVTIISCNDFRNSILKNKFADTFKKAFEEILGFEIDIHFEIDPEIENRKKKEQSVPEPVKEDTSKPEQPREYTSDINTFNKEESSFTPYMTSYTFDNFIVGESNKYAHAASWRVATSIPGSVYNPLFIYGRSGLGKTHLMLAIRDQFKKRNPGINILYTTSEKFMNEFIACITNKDMAAFRDKYRKVDALFIDDIQFIKKKVSTQEEFFHTFNDLVNNGKQIVLTSDRPPKEIENLDERIKTRFESGLTADIHSPDIETRTAIVIKKAEDLGLKLSQPITNYIAEKIKDNIRQIEGTVKKIAAMKSLHGIEPTMALIQDIIKDIAADTRPVSAIVEDIIEEIADKYDTTKEDITSEKRDANIKNARNEAIYIIREVTGVSLENIGSYFGGKKHSTIKHSIDMVEERIKKDPTYKSSIHSLISNFRNER